MKKQEFIITGMSCAACQANITKAVSKLDGVKNVDVNLLSGKMNVEFDEALLKVEDIIGCVKGLGYGAEVKGTDSESGSLKQDWNKSKQSKKNDLKTMRIRLILSFVLLIPLLYVSMGEMIGIPQFWFFKGTENALVNALYQLVLTSIIMIINKKFFISGFKVLVKKSPNMDSLVSLGSMASFIYSLIITFIMAFRLGEENLEAVMHLKHNLYYESAATILSLVLLGKFFESLSKQRTTSALDKLVNLVPKTANVIRDGKEISIESSKIELGDIVVIRPGDIVSADGEVVEGEGYLDQSAITGESMPIKRASGDSVISASICTNGSFKFRATKVGENTTLAEIIKLVEDAGNSKAPISRIADKVSGVFVPIVILISLLTFIVWICVTGNIASSLQSMISVLVISCPCALGLATPVAIMVATGKSASLGILIKSAEALETLHKTSIIVFDKTGTITTGSPSVTDVEVFANIEREKLLKDLSALEQNSNHPLALAIKQSVESNECEIYRIEDFKNENGGGISASVNGELWCAGNLKFIKKTAKINKNLSKINEVLEKFNNQGKTTVIFSKGEKVQGIVAIADKIRDESKSAIEELKSLKIKTVMLSGDSKLVAESVAKEVGIEEVVAEVLPANKEQIVREYQEAGNLVAMVGDGINDSPALTRADVGIAVSSGTDIAIDSADMVLTNNSLESVVTAVKLSKATIRNIKMNLFWAFFYNALGIPLAAGVFYSIFGWSLSPMIAALAMSFSSVCVVLSALSLNLFNVKKSSKLKEKEYEVKIKEEIKMRKTIKINGMMCGHCVSRVTDSLTKIDGVISADVSLEEKQAIVEVKENVTDEMLKSTIENDGYEVVSIENN